MSVFVRVHGQTHTHTQVIWCGYFCAEFRALLYKEDVCNKTSLKEPKPRGTRSCCVSLKCDIKCVHWNEHEEHEARSNSTISSNNRNRNNTRYTSKMITNMKREKNGGEEVHSITSGNSQIELITMGYGFCLHAYSSLSICATLLI